MAVPINKRGTLRKYLTEAFPGQAVALGQVQGFANARIEGINTSLVQLADANVWDYGGLYPYLSAGTQIQVVSTSPSDTLLGTGAQVVRVLGLDADHLPVVEDINMNGTAPVLGTLTNWWRINAVIVLGAAVSGQNSGTINVSPAGLAVPIGVIRPGEGRSRMALGTTSQSTTATITKMSAHLISGRTDLNFEVGLFVRNHPAPVWVLEHSVALRPGGTTSIVDKLEAPIMVPSSSDVELRVITNSDKDTEVLASMEGFLYDNDIFDNNPGF